jgi:hypothetical protein
VIFKFVVGRTLVEYRVSFDYDQFPFEFNIRDPYGFLQNGTMINKRLASINAARGYRMVALNPVEWGDLQFYIDCSVYFYPSGTVYAWNVRTNETLPADVQSAIEVWRLAYRPLMIGTLSAHRQIIHDEAKQEIRDRARRQATNMRDNGMAVLAYLDELEGAAETTD